MGRSGQPIAGRLVFINTASGSFHSFGNCQGRRVVLTANDRRAAVETIFPEFFTKAFEEPEPISTRTSVSIWEAFTYEARVHDWFDALGQLATERPPRRHRRRGGR
jgi:hypothetical protein